MFLFNNIKTLLLQKLEPQKLHELQQMLWLTDKIKDSSFHYQQIVSEIKVKT